MIATSLSWSVARASGLVAWALLATSVLLGLAMSLRALRGVVTAAWALDLHRFIGGLAAIFTGVHVVAILVDGYVGIGWADALLPFTSPWKPLAVTWGVVGLWLLLAVELTSLARSRLPNRLWHLVHLAAFPLLATATVHLLSAGTDSASLVTRVVVGSVTGAAVALTALRAWSADRRPTTTPHRPTHRDAGGPATRPMPLPVPDQRGLR